MDLKNKIEQFLSSNSSYELEYHQAVMEVFNDLYSADIINSEDSYNDFIRLIEPDRVIKFKVEWLDDENKVQLNRGWRVQFNNVMGPYKGGLRFHPSVNESILKFLGFEQVFKNTLTGLPMGGAKGGSDFNPKEKSNGEIMRFCQAYMTELHNYIGADIDIPAGDIGVGTREIGYMYGHYLKMTNKYTGSMTGKHPNFGGSCGREEATGYGCAFILRECVKDNGDKLEGKTAIVSGSGNVALYAVEKLISMGVKVLTISDSDGTLYFKNGISSNQLKELQDIKFNQRKRLFDWKGEGEYLSDETPWGISADIVMPCATQNEVDLIEAEKIIKNKATYLVEGANMPLTEEAINLVNNKGINYIPAKAANAGGVAVSGFERSQNSKHDYLTKNKIEEMLEEVMRDIYQHCKEHAGEDGSLKSGANIYAYKKVMKTMKFLRG